MRIWLDEHLSPQIAAWINAEFDIECSVFAEHGLRTSKDAEAFMAAREAGAVVMTKDSDFVALLRRHGPPPQVVWLTCGNTSNAALRRILVEVLPEAIKLLDGGESLIEIDDSI